MRLADSTSAYRAPTTLSRIIAQIVHFAHDDYAMGDRPGTDKMPESVSWSIAYVVTCFLAQHTPRGQDGVLSEEAWEALRPHEFMSYERRLALARELVRQYGLEE